MSDPSEYNEEAGTFNWIYWKKMLHICSNLHKFKVKKLYLCEVNSEFHGVMTVPEADSGQKLL